MAAPLVRHEPQNNESSTRIKRAAESDEHDDRSALMPDAPTPSVKMKIPRGMPVLPGGRRMPPLPIRLRESLEPLRRSLAPLRRSLAPLFDGGNADLNPQALTRKRRWPVVVLLLVVAMGVAVFLLSRGS